MGIETLGLHSKTVLVVDDSPDILALISSLLKNLYSVKVANSGKKALAFLEKHPKVDLVLLDIMMPEMSGHEVIKIIKASSQTHDIPVVFLTSKNSVEDEKLGLDLGASDYIAKPILPATLLARVKTQIENKAFADFLKDQNSYLEDEVKKRTQEIRAIQDVTIFAMASLAETRDSDTGNHIRRTQHYVKLLAEKLKFHPRFSAYLSDKVIDTIFKSAPLHDIGKVGIPDHILLKPGKLTPEEFEIMKTHTTLGRDAIAHSEEQLGYAVDFLNIAKEIAHFHQEKYDGSGYPLGLKGEEIPISVRLMALADVYDALISRRVYKEAITHEKAVAIIKEGRGKHFDPDIVDAFLALCAEFEKVAERFSDNIEALHAK